MKNVEIILKTQAISSVFDEYLGYYEPIYMQSIKSDSELLPRSKRRDFERSAIDDFKKLRRTANRFSRLFENKLPVYFDMSVDALCEALDNIKIIENESETTNRAQNEQRP
jgi:hypothetical protein